ncbi:unnamed protein product [Choristocarpus tenellus]
MFELKNVRETFLKIREHRTHEQSIGLDLRAEEMATSWDILEADWEALQQKMDVVGIENFTGRDTDMIRLNVGGTMIAAWRSTLTQVKGSRLAALFEVEWGAVLPRDDSGFIFLDESPSSFEKVIDLLLKQCSGTVTKPLLADDKDGQFSIQRMANFLGTGSLCPRNSIGGGSTTLLSSPTHQDEHLKVIEGWCLGSLGHLQLLYRATRDGFTAAAFHSRCDTNSPTLSLIRCGEAIVGGFSDQPWAGNACYRSSNTAFLFSLRDQCGKFVPSKLNVKQHGSAVCCNPIFGPIFGVGHDLHIDLKMQPSILAARSSGSYDWTGEAARVLRGINGQVLAEVEVFLVTCSALSPAFTPTSPLTEPVVHTSKNVDGIFKADVERFGLAIACELQREQAALDRSRTELGKTSAIVEAASSAFFSMFGSTASKECNTKMDPIVELNVRGTLMSTLQSTLCLCTDSALAARFNNKRWSTTDRDIDEKGRHLIDCNPLCFAKILDVLRVRKREVKMLLREKKMSKENCSPYCVCVSINVKEIFEEVVNLYFPGRESFIMDWVEIIDT